MFSSNKCHDESTRAYLKFLSLYYTFSWKPKSWCRKNVETNVTKNEILDRKYFDIYVLIQCI